MEVEGGTHIRNSLVVAHPDSSSSMLHPRKLTQIGSLYMKLILKQKIAENSKEIAGISFLLEAVKICLGAVGSPALSGTKTKKGESRANPKPSNMEIIYMQK